MQSKLWDSHTVRLNLPRSDISIIPGMADYPAAIIHPDTPRDDLMGNPIGTGPYMPEMLEVGVRSALVLNPDHDWWGKDVLGGPYLDRIEYTDYGTDPAAWVAAAEADEVDALYFR